jgi:hypothetical protein
MRRLFTLLLCLLTASGATAGSAPGSRVAAPSYALGSAPGRALSAATGTGTGTGTGTAHSFAPSGAADEAISRPGRETGSETSPETSREVPGVDPVWAAEATVVVRPAQNGVTSSHAGHPNAGGMATPAWPAVAQHRHPAGPATLVAVGCSVARRGYHATAPPVSDARVRDLISSTISTHPMARPA